eukprot:7226364-Pyramimonas_sp.AAC.1
MEDKNEEVQCVILAMKRLDKARENSIPAEFEEWCGTCRASEMQTKLGGASQSRLAFNLDGQYHPQEINMADGYTWVT